MNLRGVVPALPEVLVFSMKKRGNQIVFCSKMTIEAGFGNASLFHYKIHAHCTYAAAIEEGRSCFEDALSHIHCAVGRTCYVDLRTPSHSGTSETDLAAGTS
jgi:hypothetical protein